MKEEDSPPASPPQPSDAHRDDDATPAVQPSSKKRRVTLSAIPHPSPPVSPVPPAPDDPPRPILKHQKQPDQRREPLAVMVAANLAGDQPTTSKLSRVGRVSPTTIPLANRTAITPPPLMVEPAPKPVHALPPPPISFARRRAAQPGARKKKPADILISPRGAGPSDPLAPVIQSAPPVADRFPMAIPRLPIVLNNAQTTRRVATNVPPTPTRFSLQGTAAPLISSAARTMPSPPNPSVPIASALVPPTPHALHHPGYTGDKSAFLAPFEVFYEALNDSKQLKTWLSDQLQKSTALMMSLKQQQEKMDEIVEDLVEKRTRAMREEMSMLRQRMESLEEALLAVRAGSTREQDGDGYGYPQGTKFHQNGNPPGFAGTSPEPPSVSPSVEVTRRPEALGGHNRSTSGPLRSRPTRLWSYPPGEDS